MLESFRKIWLTPNIYNIDSTSVHANFEKSVINAVKSVLDGHAFDDITLSSSNSFTNFV